MSCGAAPVPRLTSAGERTPHSFQRMTQHFWLLYPHLLFWRPPSPPALLISEHYFVFFTLKTSLWCRPLQLSNRPNISFCDKDSTISLSTFMDAAVCAFGQTRSAVFAHLHLSCFNSTALPVDYLWVGPSGSSVPLRLPQTNHRPPFHWMLLTTKGWVLNYLWFFLANSVGNNSEQGNQGYIWNLEFLTQTFF